MKSNYDMIIWIFIFLLIALIIGLYTSEKKRIPPSLFMRTNTSTPYIEHFEQTKNDVDDSLQHLKVVDGYRNSQTKGAVDDSLQHLKVVDGYRNSSSFDVSGGASSKYGWGINDSKDYERTNLENKKQVEKKEKCIQKKDNPICTKDYIEEKTKEGCNKCDILQHNDIDKYVLKSSVPACPKIDLNNYIKKSEIPACPPKIDLSEYIKKSEIPPIPTIEKCPTCPTIPENLKERKEIEKTYQFNILDIKNLKNEDIQLLLKDERIKNYLDSEYEKKNNIPKPNHISLSEESLQSNNLYNNSSSLWDEIKSLFGFHTNKNKESILYEEELNDMNNLQNNIITNASPVSSISSKSNKLKTEEEEENKMVYNKDCVNQNFFKQDQSNAMGLYAGDSLYASV